MPTDDVNLAFEMFEDIAKRLGLGGVNELRPYLKTQLAGYEGDYAITLALKTSKTQKISLQEAAEGVKSALSGCKFIKDVRITNGYVNFWLDYDYIATRLLSCIGEDYGSTSTGKGKKVMVEHTSVNPSKAIHIGHARNAAIGDALSRLLKLSSHDVIVTNYIDDTGVQVADDIVGIKYLGLAQEKPGVKIDHYMGDEVYVKVNEMYSEDASLLEKRREVLKDIDSGDNETAELTRNVVEKVLAANLQTLWRLNVFYDLLNYESHILAYKFWDIAFGRMKELGIVRYEQEGERKGCWIFPSRTGKKEEDKILVRSDGTVVYAGKDIAYAMWKHGLLGKDFRYKKRSVQKNGETLWSSALEGTGEQNHPTFNDVDMSVNVIDTSQGYEQDVVKSAIELLGKGKGIKYHHYKYEVVALSPATAKKFGMQDEPGKNIFKMSGRKGVYVLVDDFLDSLKRVLVDETVKRNPNLSREECEEIAEKLSVSIFRYEMVRTDPGKMVVFDVEEALKLEGKSAAYLNYTYARISSILSKVGVAKPAVACVPELNNEEKALLLEIMRFPEIIEKAARELNLTVIVNYISDFALKFNSFYTTTPVLKAEGDLAAFRLWLTGSCRTVLYNTMTVLGLLPAERM